MSGTVRDGNVHLDGTNGNSLPEAAPETKKQKTYIVNPQSLATPREGLEIDR